VSSRRAYGGDVGHAGKKVERKLEPAGAAEIKRRVGAVTQSLDPLEVRLKSALDFLNSERDKTAAYFPRAGRVFRFH